LADEARSQFESGYRAALAATESLGQWSIEHLATRYQWDVESWASSYAEASVRVDMGQLSDEFRPDRKVICALGKALGSFISPYFDDSFTPDSAYLRGFSQALRDLWAAVFQGTPQSGKSP